MANDSKLPMLMGRGSVERVIRQSVTEASKLTEERVWKRAEESWASSQAEVDYQAKSNLWYSMVDVLGQRSAITEAQRQEDVKRSRTNFRVNPLVRRAAKVYFDFVFGRGVSTPRLSSDWVESLQQAEGKEPGDSEEQPKAAASVEAIVRQFWFDRWIQFYLTGYPAQLDRYYQLLRDGEMPLLIAHKAGQFSLSVLDSLELVDVIEHRSKPGVPVLWKRQYGTRDGGQAVEWYQAIECYDDPEEIKSVANTRSTRQWGARAGLRDKSNDGSDLWLWVVRLNRFDTLALRGHPEFHAAIPWCAAVQEQTANLRTYCRALSAWAWKEKLAAGAGAGAIATARGALASTLDGSVNRIVTGAVRVEGEGHDLEPIDVGSGGAQAFRIGIEESLKMVYSGLGLSGHYFGEESPGGLAAADRTELAVRKLFESEQQFWTSIYDSLFQWCARLVGIELNTQAIIEVDFPALVEKDSAGLLTGLSSAVTAGYVAPEDACRVAAYQLGADDVEAWVERLSEVTADNTQSLTEIESLIEREPLKAAPIVLRWARKVERAARESRAKENHATPSQTGTD